MGKAVVSTSIGAEGLDVTPARDLLIADSPQSFAASILELLHHPERRRACEQSAAALAARYDWSEISLAFAEVLRECIASFHAS